MRVDIQAFPIESLLFMTVYLTEHLEHSKSVDSSGFMDEESKEAVFQH